MSARCAASCVPSRHTTDSWTETPPAEERPLWIAPSAGKDMPGRDRMGRAGLGSTGRRTGGLMKLKGIVTVIRVPFLILALILGILGAAVAWYESRRFGSPFDMGYAFLATFGLLVAP